MNGPKARPTGLLTSAVAALAVALSATSLAGVLAGPRWWSFVLFTVTMVALVGAALRSVQLPPIVVVAGQFAALTGLVTGMFTRSGVLVVFPGPEAIAELRLVLARGIHQVQVGMPAAAETTELLCLVVLALGLVALIVDTVAVSAAAPAASGLVLLCVVAVAAALAERLLPWWSFLLGTLGFAALLTAEVQIRPPTTPEPAEPGASAGAVPVALAVGAGATAVALLAGVAFTAVGTEGRIVDAGSNRSGGGTGIGLNPFTSLRGQLDARQTVELFRVRGLEQPAYLRALTLSDFTPGKGWRQGPLDGAVQARGASASPPGLPLPSGVAESVAGSPIQVEIEPIGYLDNWLPSFGYPRHLGGIGTDWRYDPNAITVFSEHRQRAQPYTETGVLPQPDPERLRAAGPRGAESFTAIDPQYLDVQGVSSRVAELATHITENADTAFDATVAVNHWFTATANGFRYDLQTAPGNGEEALIDFLFTGRTGYCEQFASAMAIMLRTFGVPARVAVGFTPGTPTGDTRLITTDDAHAWVEAWFPDSGWLPFDPTPLTDGRTVVPSYVAAIGSPPDDVALPDGRAGSPSATLAPDGGVAAPRHGSPDRETDGEGGGLSADIITIGLGIGGVLVLAAVAGLTPLAMRESLRRKRLHLAKGGGPEAAAAAWQEVLAESADRGVAPPAGQTVRTTARRLADEHGLDESGRDGLRVLVDVVELSWYGDIRSQGERHPGVRGTTPTIANALSAVRASMARCAPITSATRLLPRSVLGRSALDRSVLGRRRR